jgi:mono/diheme cytochrome c family protein
LIEAARSLIFESAMAGADAILTSGSLTRRFYSQRPEQSAAGTAPRREATMNKEAPMRALRGALLSVLALASCERQSAATSTQQAATASPPMTDRELVERGKYLVQVGGCNDCHTTKKMGPAGPEPDASRVLSGHPGDEKLPPPPRSAGGWMVATTGSLTAWSGPWGRTYAANLTPDAETGLGTWTEDEFKQALKTGKHRGAAGSRDILPPMPWFNYSGMTDADFKAVFAYLRSIPAVKNPVPPPLPPSPAVIAP